MPVAPPPHAKCVFHGVYFDVWQWQQELFDGSYATFECITRPDTVAVIAFLDPDTVLLIHEEHPVRAPFIDIPGGRVDAGEEMEVAAKRELMEETGYSARTFVPYQSKDYQGMTRFKNVTYVAAGLETNGGSHMDPGERITVQPTKWKDAVNMALHGKLRREEGMLAILALEFTEEGRAIRKSLFP